MTIFHFALLALSLASGTSQARIVGPGFHEKAAAVARSIMVDKSGSGDFTTVQAAINSVKPGNSEWVRIHVKAGTYKEKVIVPWDKQFIYLEGEDEVTTTIQWSDHGDGQRASTFRADADNFLASHITFKNTYDFGSKGPRSFHVAPAIVIWGDKSAFYNCRFISLQDTLGDWRGRHLFQSCYIEGGLDFIWGSGQSQYVNCKIMSTAADLAPGGLTGQVTAQGRDSSTDTSAYVFIGGSVEGTGSTYLGRAYRAFSTVIFHQTYFGPNVVPEGWDAWNYARNVKLITYAESDCKGPGSDTSGRVSWMKKLSPRQLDDYVNPAKFIDQDGWIEAQPVHY